METAVKNFTAETGLPLYCKTGAMRTKAMEMLLGLKPLDLHINFSGVHE